MTDEANKTESPRASCLSELLACKHPYYCSESNYYSNEAQTTYDTMTDFLDEMEDSDVDMNLVFRWDVDRKTDDAGDVIDGCYAEIFIMHQRKGRFWPIRVCSFEEYEVQRFVNYISKHWETMKNIWAPLSS